MIHRVKQMLLKTRGTAYTGAGSLKTGPNKYS